MGFNPSFAFRHIPVTGAFCGSCSVSPFVMAWSCAKMPFGRWWGVCLVSQILCLFEMSYLLERRNWTSQSKGWGSCWVPLRVSFGLLCDGEAGCGPVCLVVLRAGLPSLPASEACPERQQEMCSVCVPVASNEGKNKIIPPYFKVGGCCKVFHELRDVCYKPSHAYFCY